MWPFRSFPKLDTKNISHYALLECLFKLGVDINLDNISTDLTYQVVSLENLKDIITACPSNNYRYAKSSRDCDDFVRIFLGWLSQKGYGNLAVGWCRGWLEFPGKRVYHAMCWGLTNEGLYFFEPQNDKYIWRNGAQVNWGNADNFKLKRIGV
jgi:hypothetical protein